MKSCELTDLDQLAAIYSDVYKDATGMRPRHNTSGWTNEDFNREIEFYSKMAAEKAEHEAAAEAANVVELEATIERLIKTGAANRETAIRWIADAEGVNGDMQYLCYQLGLPYGYFNRAA
jgi:hypothetical protein